MSLALMSLTIHFLNGEPVQRVNLCINSDSVLDSCRITARSIRSLINDKGLHKLRVPGCNQRKHIEIVIVTYK